MKKILLTKIICLICIFSNASISGDSVKIIQSNILGALSSLILPAKASTAISILPYIIDTKIEDIENTAGEKIFLKNKKNNSSVNYTNSINYMNSLAE